MTHHERRRFLRTTAVGAMGLTLPRYLQMEAQAREQGRRSDRPRSLIFLFLYGGPSQIDIWDMKPAAPVEYRGEFSPIRTSVPGTIMVEHLPRMAALAQHYTILRTLHHVNRNHQPAGCWLMTGVNPRSDNAGQLRPRPDDPPALGSLAVAAAPPQGAVVPPFVMLPARLQDQGSAFRGQTAGWLGSGFDPLLIQDNPARAGFRVSGYEPVAGVSPQRLSGRRSLLADLDRGTSGDAAAPLRPYQEQAFDLIAGRRGRSAFDLDAEPDGIRRRYGMNPFGQGCLLARRLIEAGARVVTVSDCTANGHHEWDTHNGNFTKLRRTLLPRLDLAYTALLQDLLDRGLLEDTVVYLGGEFGRTPRIGQAGFSGAGAGRDGRDHYPLCFPGIVTGGRFRRGMTYGESDSKAAAPAKDPMTPEDLAATLFAGMGLDPEGPIYTRENRPSPLSHGRVVADLLA